MDKLQFLKECENDLKDRYEELDDIAYINQKKILDAFQENKVALRNFYGSTGYGYDDAGKEVLNKIYAKVFGTEAAVVSPLITCGTHALNLALCAVLRPNDIILSITGAPYDTIVDCIKGVENKDIGSLKDFGVKYEQIELKNDIIDEELVLQKIKTLKPKLVYMQRSRGYGWRKPLSINDFKEIIKKIRIINKDCFIFIDNCYGEFVETAEPSSVGADLVVGSLCKNPGGGIVPTGGYIVGTKRAIDLVEKRLTAPSIGIEVGSYEMGYRLYFQGLFMAPQTVKNAIKGAYLIGRVMEKLGYTVLPSSNEKSYDIIKSIKFNTSEELIKFVQLIQSLSPVDSDATPLPWEMPGYTDPVIMAAGTFVQGASIELSCDSPIRKPYVAYFQGGLTYEHIKIVAEKLLDMYSNI
ncbi:MAG: hypothetical protein E7376_00145 [Clostridiales bacterium]|nr:hypothetical protein [Clostridiales bacterium]